MLTIGAVVINVSDVERTGSFWAAALDYQPDPGNPAFLGPRSGAGPRVHLDEDDRTHLDLWAADAAEQAREVDRLVALGATRVAWDYPEGADFVVLSDPDGTLFCIIDTSA